MFSRSFLFNDRLYKTLESDEEMWENEKLCCRINFLICNYISACVAFAIFEKNIYVIFVVDIAYYRLNYSYM